MATFSFYDKQHVQKILLQQPVITKVFNHFILSISPFLKQYEERSSISVWVRNAVVENAIDRELAKLQSALLGNITSFQIDAWKRSDMKNEEFLMQYIKGMSISSTKKEGLFARNIEAMTQLQKGFDARGNMISDKVWNISEQYKTQLEFYLKTGLADGRNASQISSDLRQVLKDPDKRFRKVRNREGKLVLSQPIKDYHPGKEYGPGVYRSSYMNALRLTSTSTNIAYRSADHDRWSKQDFITGIEVHRSANNKGPCKVCDAMVGDYPKTFKFTGMHPFCICFATPKVLSPEEMADYLLTDKVPSVKVVRNIPKSAYTLANENKGTFSNAYWYQDNKQFFA